MERSDVKAIIGEKSDVLFAESLKHVVASDTDRKTSDKKIYATLKSYGDSLKLRLERLKGVPAKYWVYLEKYKLAKHNCIGEIYVGY